MALQKYLTKYHCTVIQKSKIKEEIGKNEVITVAQLNIDK